MTTTEIPMLYTFLNPFDPWVNKIIVIWINEFRKHDGSYVIVDWSAKALARALPKKDIQKLTKPSWYSLFQPHTGYPNREILVRDPIGHSNLRYELAKALSMKPIRKLRGVLRSDRKIPGWALDASPMRVVREFAKLSGSTQRFYLTIPDCSEARLVDIIKDIQQFMIKVTREQPLNARNRSRRPPNFPTIIFNPALTFKESIIRSIRHKHLDDETDRIHRVVPQFVQSDLTETSPDE